MIITKIGLKKNDEFCVIECSSKSILTYGDFYADAYNNSIMEVSLPLMYCSSSVETTFVAPLDEIDFLSDEGETITIKDVYNIETKTDININVDAVMNLTIKGREYKIEGVNGSRSYLSSAAERGKRSCLSSTADSIKSKLRGKRIEEIFAICYKIDTEIKQINFATIVSPFIELPTSCDIGEKMTLVLYANESNYYSIINFLKEKEERVMFKGVHNYYSLEEICIEDTTQNPIDGFYRIHIRGKLAYRCQSANSPLLTQRNNNVNSFSNLTTSNKEKEKKIMNIANIFGTNDLGKVNTAEIKYSVKGIAFRTEGGTYCTYDVDSLTATDVSDFVFDMPIFILPVATRDIQKGDIIYYNKKPYIVRANKENCIAVINPIEGKMENIIPKTSILGFSFYAKVLCPFNWTENNSTAIMNNLLPLLLMEDSNKNDSMDVLMMMSMMNGSSSNFNSFLPFMLMSDKSDKSDMMMFMMMNNNSFSAKTNKGCSSSNVPTPPLNYYSEI